MYKLFFILQLLFLLPVLSCAQDAEANKYGYPTDKSGKVFYSKTVDIPNTSKFKLFKRAEQFIALQSFDRNTEVKTKTGGYYTGQVVDKAVVYEDVDEGKIFGNGFGNFVYRGKKYFVLTFSYKIYIEENQYRYVFTDFIVKEFIHLGKSKSHGRPGAFGDTRGTSKASGSDIRSYPLERFMEFSAYDRSDDDFERFIKELKQSLRVAMLGEA